MNDWELIQSSLQTQVSGENFKNWLEPVRFDHLDDDRALHLIAPNSSAKEWLEAEYASQILETAVDVGLDLKAVVFRVGQPGPSRQTAPVQGKLEFEVPLSRFNPKYTFNGFVVGSCNEFAHAAALAVANNPARAYNPLYIYGGVGMGKTHLMHAVGCQLKRSFPQLRVVYVSTEEFMNDMIRSLRYNRMGTFHERFRSADALLVDDIQTLARKERTQEEFFHTFNALHNLDKQIVISSDRPPKEIPDLVDRLRSRFEWGLMADIQAPDLETKMAIIDRRVEDLGIDLVSEVRLYIATKMKSNIRELEGVLIKLAALASLTGACINQEMASRALQSFVPGVDRPVTMERIIQAVAEEFGLKPAQLKERTNAQLIALPRQVAMYLAKELTSASLPAIGRAFGGKHHSTVLHAIHKVQKLRHADPGFDSQINKLTDRFD